LVHPYRRLSRLQNHRRIFKPAPQLHFQAGADSRKDIYWGWGLLWGGI
jgi:hypothetical protein